MKKFSLQRFLEIIPGALTLLTFVLPIILSFYMPEVVAIFLIAYALMWLFRSVYLAIDLVMGYRKVRINLKVNWMRKCESYEAGTLKMSPYNKSVFEEIERKNQVAKFSDLSHVIIFVTYKEPLELLRQSLDSYVKAKFPVQEKLVFVLAGEERDSGFAETAKILEKEYGKYFKKFLVTIHPDGLAGEVIGKSANATWATKKFREYTDEQGLKYPHILLHNFDADTIVHPQYFAEISWRYIMTPDRTTVAFQPFHFYHNNIWNVPIFVRLLAFSCSFWKVAESQRSHKFRSFSSRSNPFQMIVDVDYWDVSVIPEDSRQYWTAWMKYRGNHPVIPLYCPLYLDAVQDDTYWKTIKAQYSQLRRWSWGITDFPWLVQKFWADTTISSWQKLYQIYDLVVGHWYWATAPLILAFLGSLPAKLNPEYAQTILANKTPEILSLFLTLSSVGILVCIGISFALVPAPPKRMTIWGYFSLIFQWILIPIVSIVFSALPAVHSQINLMRGKYLEYKVTPKTRK